MITSSFYEILGDDGTGFGLNGSAGSWLNVPSTFDIFSGVNDLDSSTLSYTSAASVPEPSSLIALALVGSSLLLTKRVKN